MGGTDNQINARALRTSRFEHGALAQILRWYTFFEEPGIPIENVLDVLDANVHLKMAGREGRGHAAFVAAMDAAPRVGSKNAHRIERADFTWDEGDAPTRLRLEIEYANTGTDPTGALRAARLAYDVDLVFSGAPLPRLASIVTTPLALGKATEVVDSYAANRVRSLFHYWLALTEDPQHRVEPFDELLAPGFRLGFSSIVIDTLEGLAAWLTGTASRVVSARHDITSFSVTTRSASSNERTFAVSADLDWHGLLPDGTHMVGASHHDWIVLDEPVRRFARIADVAVTIVEPFRRA